jgi:dTDP-4-amino-4,6-dideoxygalactose transaminase
MSKSETIQFIDLQAQKSRIRDEIDQAIGRVLDHGKFILGPEVGSLEKMLCNFSQAKHCISCASGTDSLLLYLLSQDVGPGDVIFVPAFTFVATAETVSLLGATPYFVDVDTEYFNLCPESLAAAIADAKKSGLKLKGVIAVDLFGQPADYPKIETLTKTERMFLLCDAAQSYGASQGSHRVGSIGDATSTSFFPAKPLGCYGDGGAIFTDDDEIAEKMKSLRVHGQGAHKYDVARIGINGRMDTIQAAVLIEKLRIFDDELIARQRIADRYSERLSNSVKTPTLAADNTSAWAQYTITLDNRDQVAEFCKAAQVPTAIYYPKPLNIQAPYRACPQSPGGTPKSQWFSEHVLSLPMHPYLDEATQDRIIETVNSAV